MPAPSRMFMGGRTAVAALCEAARGNTVASNRSASARFTEMRALLDDAERRNDHQQVGLWTREIRPLAAFLLRNY